jgi:hypothetical protein
MKITLPGRIGNIETDKVRTIVETTNDGFHASSLAPE